MTRAGPPAASARTVAATGPPGRSSRRPRARRDGGPPPPGRSPSRPARSRPVPGIEVGDRDEVLRQCLGVGERQALDLDRPVGGRGRRVDRGQPQPSFEQGPGGVDGLQPGQGRFGTGWSTSPCGNTRRCRRRPSGRRRSATQGCHHDGHERVGEGHGQATQFQNPRRSRPSRYQATCSPARIAHDQMPSITNRNGVRFSIRCRGAVTSTRVEVRRPWPESDAGPSTGSGLASAARGRRRHRHGRARSRSGSLLRSGTEGSGMPASLVRGPLRDGRDPPAGRGGASSRSWISPRRHSIPSPRRPRCGAPCAARGTG